MHVPFDPFRRVLLLAALVLGGSAARAAPAGESQPIEQAWANPPPAARLRAYWWWLNGNVDAAAITRDLREMKAKGFGGAVIVDAGGAEQDGNHRVPHGATFASPEWVALFRRALEQADQLGLELSLNIQSGWNLGGPRVSNDDTVKKLVWTEREGSGPGPIDIALPPLPRVDGYGHDLFVLAYRVRHPLSAGVANWPAKTLEQKLPFTGPNAFFLMNSAPKTDLLVAPETDQPGEADAAPADLVDVSRFLGADGHFRWTAPEGKWCILRFGCTLADVHRVSTQSDGWAGNAIDVFDRGAFDRYAAGVIVPLLESVRPYVGRSLKYLHTDSWEVDLINWTPTLRAEFIRRRGYDPLPYFPAFAGRIVGSRTTTDRFLNDYRKTLGDLAVDNHYRPFSELAHHYGMGIHPESGGPHYTPIDAQRCLGMDDVPMSEYWARSKTHRTTDESRFFVKQPASAAHTYGRPLVSAEAFTTIGPHWQETLWDNLKPSFDYAIGEGLNRVVWHAFVCSPQSAGVPGQQYFAGTHLNPNVTWWNHSAPFFAYLNRCQAMMQRGGFVADVLYYYGDHVPNFTQLRASDPAHVGAGYDYDVITEEALLQRATVQDHRIVLPDGMSYRLLVLPPEHLISLPVLRKVRDLVAAGAAVVGPRPDAASSLSDQPAADTEVRQLAAELWRDPATAKGGPRVIADATAREVLQAQGVAPDISFTGTAAARFSSMHRRDGGTDIYFVASRLGEPVQVDVTFRVAGRAPELWDPVTATRRFAAVYTANDGVTTVPLDLPPYGSMFVIFRAPAAEHPPRGWSNDLQFDVAAELTGAWTVGFDPQWGGPKSVEFPALVSWTERAEPGIRFYSGTATYTKSFAAPAPRPGQQVWLDLGLVRELAALRINGRPVGVVWAPPFRLDITSALTAGTNRVDIDVVNFWPNRIIGDAALPPAQRLTRTNIAKLTANTPLMPSGLLGPVRILLQR